MEISDNSQIIKCYEGLLSVISTMYHHKCPFLIIHLMAANVEDMPISGNMIDDTSFCRHLIKMKIKNTNTIVKTRILSIFISIFLTFRCKVRKKSLNRENIIDFFLVNLYLCVKF